MDSNKEKSEIGMKVSKKFLLDRGYECIDVSKMRNHNGYDIMAKKNNKEIKINPIFIMLFLPYSVFRLL